LALGLEQALFERSDSVRSVGQAGPQVRVLLTEHGDLGLECAPVGRAGGVIGGVIG
jgi:hypothetical protein